MSLLEKMYRNTLFVRHDDDGTLFYFSAADFPGLKKEPYSFTAKAGHRLNGYFYSYDNAIEDRIVVFDHGMGAGHRAYLKEIEMLARHGYLVYSYDHTGCTESEGESIMGFAGSLADLDSCISSIKADFPGKAISVVGHSWGGFSTLNIAAYHPDVKHVVAMAGFVSVKSMQKQVVPFILRPFIGCLYKLEEKTNPDYVSASAIDALSGTEAHALVIHSTDDKTVSFKRHFERLRRVLADRPNVRFLELSGKDHNPNYTLDAVKYKNDFFKIYSAKRKAGELNSDEAKAKFKASYDWERMTMQDESVWREIFSTLDS